MKDYTLEVSEKEKFILYYECDNDKIFIYTADGEVHTYDYNNILEKSILNKMKEQVINSDKFYIKKLLEKSEYTTSYDWSNNLFWISALGVFLNGVGLAELSDTYNKICLLIMNVNCFLMWHYDDKSDKLVEVIKDVEKNKFFVENEDLFSEKFDRSVLESFLTNANVNTKELIRDILNKNVEDDERIYPTINDLDSISFSALKELVDLLEKDNKGKERILKKES